MTTRSSEVVIPVISPIAPTFDLAQVRCAAEAALSSLIEKNAEFHARLLKRAADSDREGALIRGKMSLITESYRVDPAITPKIAQLSDLLRDTLRVVQPIDVYVKASPEPNAFCLPSRKGTRLVMCLNSSLFDLLTPHELLFIMGHELGHAVLGHARVPRIDFDEPDFSPLEVVRIRALGRRQEISCDRVGLLACQDVRVAGSALFKIMCGLPERWLEFDALAYAKHFDHIGELADVAPMDDAVSTHPIIALRTKALLVFSDSQLYADGLGQSPGAQVNEQFEKMTEHMLSTLEPDLSELESASEQEAGNRFLIRGALMVVMADQAFDRDEVQYLKAKMTLSEETLAAMERPDFADVSLREMAGDAAILNQKLSVPRRAGLLHELCLVALAAGGYATAEQESLVRIAQMLEIPPGLFQQVVEGAEAPGHEAVAASKPVKPRPRKRKPKAVTRAQDETRPAGGQPTGGEEGMVLPDPSEGIRPGEEAPRTGPS